MYSNFPLDLVAPFSCFVDELELWWDVAAEGCDGRIALSAVPEHLQDFGKNGSFMVLMMLSWLVHAVWTAEPYSRARLPNETGEEYTAIMAKNSPDALKARLFAIADKMTAIFDQLPALFETAGVVDHGDIDVPPPPKRPRLDSPPPEASTSGGASVKKTGRAKGKKARASTGGRKKS